MIFISIILQRFKVIFLTNISKNILVGDIMKIVYKVYEKRTEKNLTLRQLEELSGIGIATINRIENGIANPTIEVICQLAVALECSPYDLFYMVT